MISNKKIENAERKKSLSILVQRVVCQVLKILLILKTNKKESMKVGFNAGMKYFQKKSNIVWLSKRSYRTLCWTDFWLNKKDNDKVKENEKMTCDL